MGTSITFIHKTITATSILLMVFFLAVSTTSVILPNNSVATTNEEHSSSIASKSSSVDLYNAMELGEQELENLNENDENGDDNEKNNGDTSLLSMMTGGGNENDAMVLGGQQSRMLFKCISCTGVLPLWNEPRVYDEQSYCLPDNTDSTIQLEQDEESICSGAERCWKAKVRELDGQERISRGCVGGGHNTNRYSSRATGAHQLLHPCMGAIPVVGNSDNRTNTKNDGEYSQSSAYTVWTSSHTYSISATQQQRSDTPPPSYAVECCTGHDYCNDGPFPVLPGLPSDSEENKSLLHATWWRWSPISGMSLILVIIIVVTILIGAVVLLKNYVKSKKKKRRRRRSKNKRKRSRRFSFSFSSSNSSSLSSMSSSSSCCEGKISSKRSRRTRHTAALTMVDLLKGVTTSDLMADSDDIYGIDSNHSSSYVTPYSPAMLTESTIDDDFLPPTYKRRSDLEEQDWTSGSGYGMPVLVQRTLAKQIQLRQLVGKGRYGEVWRATYWNGGHEHVAVKIFLSKDEPSWKRETEIYSTVLMRHDNILGFIGSDIMTSRNSYTTQLLLITHYHQYGSLYDFLQTTSVPDPVCNGYNTVTEDKMENQIQYTTRCRPPLTIEQMLNVLYTIVSGLCHLHTEIHGTQGKPGIAHRDIKSKNVLIKCPRTGTCCVADFGMAVTSKDAVLPIQTATVMGASNTQNTRVGTKRYMAPEVLDDSISSAAALASASTTTTATSSSMAYWCFDAYRRGDVYSYALVMWEVMSRTLISQNIDDVHLNKLRENDQNLCLATNNEYDPYTYRAPYQDRGVGWDPGFEDMRRVVCSADPVLSRPGMADEWLANPITNAVVGVMHECWHSNPNARLTTLRVKKTLAKLIDLFTENENDNENENKNENK